MQRLNPIATLRNSFILPALLLLSEGIDKANAHEDGPPIKDVIIVCAIAGGCFLLCCFYCLCKGVVGNLTGENQRREEQRLARANDIASLNKAWGFYGAVEGLRVQGVQPTAQDMAVMRAAYDAKTPSEAEAARAGGPKPR